MHILSLEIVLIINSFVKFGISNATSKYCSIKAVLIYPLQNASQIILLWIVYIKSLEQKVGKIFI